MTVNKNQHRTDGGMQARQQERSRSEVAQDSTEDERASERGGEQDCPECGSNIIQNDGEIICESCGLVVDDEQIDRGPEWRAFNATERDQKARVGSPTIENLHDKGLSTQIDWQNRDGYGNTLTARRRTQMNRLRKWNKRTRVSNGKERNIKQAFGEINRMCSALGLPDDAKEVAAMIYRRATDEDLLRGRSIEGVASSGVYAACRMNQIARTLDEITNVSRVGYREIARAYRYISRELNLDMKPTDPQTYIPRFSSDLNVNHDVEQTATEIVSVMMDKGLHSGKSPPAIAAGAIYAAGLIHSQKLTQDEVSEVAQVSNVTIRNRYQEQLEAYSAEDYLQH